MTAGKFNGSQGGLVERPVRVRVTEPASLSACVGLYSVFKSVAFPKDPVPELSQRIFAGFTAVEPEIL